MEEGEDRTSMIDDLLNHRLHRDCSWSVAESDQAGAHWRSVLRSCGLDPYDDKVIRACAVMLLALRDGSLAESPNLGVLIMDNMVFEDQLHALCALWNEREQRGGEG